MRTTHAAFQKLVEKVIAEESAMLLRKADEYASDGDRLSNFRLGAMFTGLSARKTLWGYLAKHLSSVKEIVDGKVVTPETLREKIGDSRNYLILLEALVLEGAE